jgi:amino acid adenylation domain-containing protein/thioester reductase-like protein
VRRRTGRSEFMLGTAASTRQSAAETRTIGYFVNMLPLPCRAGENESIDTSVRAMQQGLADALQHSRYPFARIYGDLRRERPQATHPARYPLFDIAVTENPSVGVSPETGLRFTGIAAPEIGDVIYELRRNGPGQDLVLVHEGQPDGGLILTWYVNAAIYTQDTARIWFDALVGWMQFLADAPHEEGKPLPLLLPQEENLLDDLQNGPSRPLPANSFPDLFRRLAEAYPERPALITDSGVQSFKTVNTRADALAHALLELDVKRGEPVAVLTERSAALPETALAIWKAGGCYLPLTADLPAERIAFMASDAGIRILIALDGLPLPPELGADCYTILRPEELHDGPVELHVVGAPVTPDDLAYIIYTSGSTGVPKGVVLRHGGMLNLGMGEPELLGIRSDDRALMMSSPSFDLWISDLVTTWSVGAALVPIRREEMNDISGMLALIQRLGVTVLTTSPSYLHLFERADLPGLRILMTVGEPPIPDDARHYAAKLSYFNGYGPAENTAGTTFGRVRADAEQITAGRPISNTAVYIVDESGKPVPPGVIGEIWLGGMGLAAGYLNRPDLTAAGFVDTAGGRRYRSGDLGRWLRSGELQLLGRLDTQVKLRGQRVELGEIEHRLAAYPGVQQALAVVETLADQTQMLRSFVTLDPQAAAPTQAEWSTYLSESLPSYMIPSAIFRVPTIPLTAAGKVDSQALLGAMETDAGFAASLMSEAESKLRTPPQNAIEKRVSEVWAEQLGLPFIAREDNFFELGGNSLKAIAAISRLRREFECRVNDLYEHPVLADFARICRPRPDHLRAIVRDVCGAWEGGHGVHAGSEAEREDALRTQRTVYEAKIRATLDRDLKARQPYRHVLLTGATGYLGSYLLRELLADRKLKVTALVRGSDNRSARARLGQVLTDYFGAKTGTALRNSKRLNVLAGDLRQAELLLSPRDHGHLAATVDAIYHCAANVNHFGHYRDFHADNVAATRHLLPLATRRKPLPADFHFVSTLSVAGSASPADFRLFTEYDLVSETPDDNYYIRTKQEAERLVITSRGELANACIHRIGNISFATDSARLQRNVTDNAFFRQIVAFLRLGVVPVELNASICHVDVVARALIALSGTETLTNEIHHIETARHDRLADFIRTADGMADRVRACDFGAFLERLRDAIDEPEMESALAETVETFGLQSGRSYLAGLHRLAVASDRTQALLEGLGIAWPTIPEAGQKAMLRAAVKVINP